MREGPIPNAGDAFADGDRCQAAAPREGQIPNAGHAVGYRDRGQAAAFPEGPIPNAGDSIGYHYFFGRFQSSYTPIYNV